ncbi:MAG TPA: polysaccharide biosynthesis C-terminal domain-containing protein [Modestobacter sp.]|nr:polysaccharide biosynthesis C-terminal domain-containing protein [Modestobacter sp.]
MARGGALSLVGAAVSAATGVLVVLAITRSLQQETAGIFFALTSIFLIGEMVARLGTGTGLVWAISRARALGQPGRVPDFLRVALTPVVALAVVMAVVLFVAAPDLSTLVAGERSSEVTTAVRILAVLLPLTTLSDTLVSATRGYSTVRPTVLLDKAGRPLLQLLAVVAVVGGAGSVAAVSAAWAAPWVVSAVLAGCWLHRLHRAATRPAGVTGEPVTSRATGVWREFWAFTGPRAVTSVVQLALQRLDIILLTLLAGPAQAAIYTAATRFLVVGQFANQALTSVVEPRLARLLALGDRRTAQDVYRTATGWLVLLCWPFYLVFATYAAAVLDWFGTGYDAGWPVVLILAATMLLATAVGMVDVVLIMGGRTSWNLANSLTALVVNVAVDVALIPHLGMLGAALGWAAAIMVNNLLPLTQIWRSLRLHPFGPGTLLAMALSLGCFGVPALIARWIGGETVYAVPAGTVVGAALFVLGCARWRRVLALDALAGLRRSSARTARAAGPDGHQPGQVDSDD